VSTATKLADLQRRYAREWATAKGFDRRLTVERNYRLELRQALKDQPNPDGLIDAAVRNMKAGK
jgi:hypothetical protein